MHLLFYHRKVSDNGDEKNKDDRKEKRDAEESEKPQEIKEGIIENDENKRDQEEDGNKEKKGEENGEDAKEKSRWFQQLQKKSNSNSVINCTNLFLVSNFAKL